MPLNKDQVFALYENLKAAPVVCQTTLAGHLKGQIQALKDEIRDNDHFLKKSTFLANPDGIRRFQEAAESQIQYMKTLLKLIES